MALRLRSAPIWKESKSFSYARTLARASLTQLGKAAGIAACDPTAKAIGIAMRLCICVGRNGLQVA